MMKKIFYCSLIWMLGCNSRPNSDFESLDLTNHSLTSIPDSVFLHTKLEVLYLGNAFRVYPPLSAFNQDHSVSPDMNHISQIPADIKKLKRLRVLDISSNDLRSLPKALTKLEQLDTLDISFNKDLQIAKEFPVLEKLQSLRWLNIGETVYDEKVLARLKHALYKTTIVTRLEEQIEDAP